MRSTLILGSALAGLAWASPIEQREASPAPIKVLMGNPIAREGDASVDAAADNTIIIPDVTPINLTIDFNLTPDKADLEKRAAARALFYSGAAVKRHNVHRTNHGAGPLVWNETLAVAAMKSAKRCTFAHYMNENNLTSYGQNLALGWTAPNIASIITDGWYSEVQYYTDNYGVAQPDYGTNNANLAKWGHFTQVVWKATSQVGCATWRCSSVATSATDSTPLSKAYGGDITYCNYQSPGNYGGEYAENVGEPLKTQNISVTAGVNRVAIAKSYGKKTGQKWTPVT